MISLFRLIRSKNSYKNVIIKSFDEDVPEKTGGVIYIVGEGNKRKRAMLQCPCGCGKKLTINLMKRYNPYWDVKIQNNKATFKPSLRVKACGSHFFIVDNKVYWCKHN